MQPLHEEIQEKAEKCAREYADERGKRAAIEHLEMLAENAGEALNNPGIWPMVWGGAAAILRREIGAPEPWEDDGWDCDF